MSLQTTRMRLPMALDEVTPEWLSDALATRFPGVRVAAAERDAERAGTSTSARFALLWDDDGGHADLPDTVYVKGGFDPVMRRRVWAALIQEARFYAELAQDAPINIPTVYFAGIDEDERQGVLILEDMTRRNVRFGHATDYVSPDLAAAILEGQAQLHARFWNDPRLPGYAEWAQPQRTYLRYLYRPKHWVEVQERSYGDLLRQVLPSPEQCLTWLEQMWAHDDARVPTLLHGDCHGGNLFFEADGSPGFLDWQCTFPGAPGHDHAEMLLSSLTVEDRRANERNLIAHYREVLVANGASDAPSLDSLFLSYRQNIMHMMASSVMNPYDMQTQEVTDTTAKRSLQAALDLDMASALATNA
ncbi:aminoglycoside phosphotransferase family protein [Sphingomonas colocasiae]|uniref:Aminoglycoside phosphotransferase family protein n=1 Tax=Sphingomonas colocasiae TaxID=1848973 RepID=A0ABS7PSS3_9SPHN|nr:aminoglycoside phosphotransferase family protein [Sphingomonas colocasiae]MBY8824316.1 aminoglycoside phosphotransferase family protein [Sphingomonas colocasiae]